MTSLPLSSSPTPLPPPDTAATDTVATTVGNTSGGGGDSGIINDCTSLLQKRHDCYVKHYTIEDLLDTAADGGRGHNIDHTIHNAIIPPSKRNVVNPFYCVNKKPSNIINHRPIRIIPKIIRRVPKKKGFVPPMMNNIVLGIHN